MEEARAAQARAQQRRRIFSAVAVVLAIVAVGFAISVFGGDDGDEQAVETDAGAEEEAEPEDGTDEGSEADPAGAGAPEPPDEGAAITGETPCPPADGSAERTTSFEQPPPMCIDPGASYTATFATTEGDVTVDLNAEQMPNTVNNFVVLARYGYYDDTALFRTDPTIGIIQGGSPTTNSPSDPGPGYTIEDEGGEFTFDEATGQGTGPFTYEPGQLIMARSAGPDSSGAQFFFSASPEVANLDSQGTYLLFGEVTEGLEVLEEILASHEAQPANPLGGAPAEPVIIEEVTITEG